MAAAGRPFPRVDRRRTWTARVWWHLLGSIRYSAGLPNHQGYPNISPEPNHGQHAADIDAVVASYESLMQRLIGGHAPEFTEVDVTMAQAKVLYVVMAAGELHMAELATRLGVTPSTTSELVERLVELGYVIRRSDPTDRRQVAISPTPAALELLERFRELNQRQLRELLGRLDAEELATVDRAIGVLGHAVDRTAATAGTTSIGGNRP
jgi:DNA-binding MarR family transcriptional regulator